MRRLAPAFGVALLALSSALLLAPLPAEADTVVGDLTVSSLKIFRNESFLITGNITVLGGGTLVLDNTSVQFRLNSELEHGIIVLPGGELRIVNGSTVSSAFASVAYSLRYLVYVAPGAHFVLQNSTLDYPYSVGVGDEYAVIADSQISHAMIALYGPNLTATRMRFLSNFMGPWLSNHSVIRDSSFSTSDNYGAYLEGNASVENSSFEASNIADLALLDFASARNTTHRGSARAFLLNGQPSVTGATIQDEVIAGIQLGHSDFPYGCGLFAPLLPPLADFGLNYHGFPFYYRVNNSVSLTDISISGTDYAFAFGREPWRRASIVDLADPCNQDPPPPEAAQPLFNTIQWTVTRPTAISAVNSVFNGSLLIQSGASLDLSGASWRFEGTGGLHQISIDGGSFAMRGSSVRTVEVDYANDSIVENRPMTPNLDILVRAGSLRIEDSLLQDLGTATDPFQDSGIVISGGAGPVEVVRSRVADSARLFTLGCCGSAVTGGTEATLEDSSVSTEGYSTVLRGGTLRAVNTTMASSSGATVYFESGAPELLLFGSDAQLGGPASAAISRFGFLRARVLWEDLRPVDNVSIAATDMSTGELVGNFTTGRDGWAAPTFLRYRNTTWDGASEQGETARLFRFSASFGAATGSIQPVDISAGAMVTIVLPDDRPPQVSLGIPAEYYTRVSGGVVNGTAQDNETGVTLVERSLDGGPYFAVTAPSAPRLGEVNFSFTLSGLAEGIHVVAVRAWDSVGNTAETYSYFIVDQRIPSLFLDFPFDLTTNQRDLNITGRLSEPGWITIKGFTTFVSAQNGSFSVPFHFDRDSETVEAGVLDLAGNAGAYFFVARLDQTPPLLEITSPADGDYFPDAHELVSGRIEVGAQLFLNGVPILVADKTTFTVLATLTEGENFLALTALDIAGNVQTRSLTVYLDPDIPPLDLLFPDLSRPLKSAQVTFTVRTEPGATLTVGNITLVANGTIVNVTLQLPEGRSVVPLGVVDRAGNAVRRSLILIVDTLTPPLSIVGGTHISTSNATVRFFGSTEPNANVLVGDQQIQADGEGAFAMTVRVHTGTNLILVVARDAAGNEQQAVVTVEVAAPPLAGAPGFAAPGVGPSALVFVGVAACVLVPLLARRLRASGRP